MANPSPVTAVAWDLIGYDGTPDSISDEALATRLPQRGRVRVVGKRALWEQVDFNDSTPGDYVRLGRVDVGERGLRTVVRYVDPDTPLEVIAS